MIEAGSGHKMPALAVKEAISARYPGKFQIDVVDLAKESKADLSDWFLKESWNFALKHRWLAKKGYSLVQLPFAGLYLPFFFRDFLIKGSRFVSEYGPDIVFSTHFYCSSASCYAREKYNLSFKIISCVIDPHKLWNEKKVDYVIMDPRILRDRNILAGIPDKKVRLMEFPISSRFLNRYLPEKAAQLRTQLGLDPSKKTALVAMGGQGIGKFYEYIMEIYRQDLPLNILCVCGKNTKMKTFLEKWMKSKKSKTVIIPFGQVSDMEQLLAVSDFVIGKGGPSSTFEAVSMGRPIIYIEWATYTEKPLIDFITNKNAGYFAETKEDFINKIKEILSSDILSVYKKNITALNYKSGAGEIAEFIVRQEMNTI